jgi:hypothetical protein
MRIHTVAAVALLAGLVLPVAMPPAVASPCDPYPIGRCGAFDQESVVFCYAPGPGNTLTTNSPTDFNAIELGTDGVNIAGEGVDVGGVVPGAKDVAYLRLTPTESFATSPQTAPLPTKSTWQESNSVPGLQVAAFACANFIWFEVCDPPQWMGPYNIVVKARDTMVA